MSKRRRVALSEDPSEKGSVVETIHSLSNDDDNDDSDNDDSDNDVVETAAAAAGTPTSMKIRPWPILSDDRCIATQTSFNAVAVVVRPRNVSSLVKELDRCRVHTGPSALHAKKVWHDMDRDDGNLLVLAYLVQPSSNNMSMNGSVNDDHREEKKTTTANVVVHNNYNGTTTTTGTCTGTGGGNGHHNKSDFGPGDEEGAMEYLRQRGVDMSLIEKTCVVSVLTQSPRMRWQMENNDEKWPVCFHENKSAERALAGKLFDDSELQFIDTCMQAAIAEARKGIAEGEVSGIGAIVVDPVARKVVARHHHECGRHPLRHATMLCLRTVGLQQVEMYRVRPGKFPDDPDMIVAPAAEAIGTAVTTDVMGDGSLGGSGGGSIEPRDEAERGAEVAAAAAAEAVHSEGLDKPNGSLPSVAGAVPRPPNAPHLLSTYDLYTTLEPCVMCSMALVHSRVRRVFFGSPLVGAGGLGGVRCLETANYGVENATDFTVLPVVSEGVSGVGIKVHSLKTLNHHFECFGGVRESECRHLANGDSTS